MMTAYFDYSANTPVEERVLDCFVHTERSFLGNPNADHALGHDALKRQQEISERIGSLFHVSSKSLIYTSGASEANNLAIKGIARSFRHQGKHILSTMLEHPSVSSPLSYLQQLGYEVELVNIDRDGRIDLIDLQEKLRQDTILLAFSSVDSELGVIQPLEEILEITRNYPHLHVHVDATQAIGKLLRDYGGVDTLSLSAHKIYGLNGSGLLIKKEDLVLEPLIHGGGSLTIYRSGTPTLALNAALNEALEIATENLDRHVREVASKAAYLRETLADIPKVRINSPLAAVPHVLNLSIQGISGSEVQKKLSDRGILVSVKTACSVDSLPSRAVMAVTRDRKRAREAFRISLSHQTTPAEMEYLIENLREIAERG